jgi:hypothetical protein
MGTLTKVVVATGIGGGLVAAGLYVRSLLKTEGNMETISKVSIHSIDLRGLVIRIDLTLKNPSKTSFKIKFPFMKVVFAGDTIGTSQVVNKDIEIPAFGEVRVEKVLIQIPLMGLLSLGVQLFTPLQSGQSVKIQLTAITTVSYWWFSFPYEHTEDVLLKANNTAPVVSKPTITPPPTTILNTTDNAGTV